KEAKALHDAMQSAKLMSPPTDCLSPIGERLIKRGLKNVLGSLRPEFYAPPLTRDPAVYSGNPFQVEIGIVYGGDLPPDQPVEVLRIAEKSAKIVNKKIPALDATITKIMGVVWIDEQIAYDKKLKRHSVTINIHNFTSAGKKLNLHLLLPRGMEAKAIDPKPAEARD